MPLTRTTVSAAPLLMGAVAYDQKVVPIWEGFGRYFRARGLDFDYVLYSSYERQVEAHVRGHLHVAWNSPLAWLQAERAGRLFGRRAQAICMRDSDRDLRSIILVRADSGISTIADLEGRAVAVGAADSPQSTLIPLSYLAEQGLTPDEHFRVIGFDVSAGKHGDHIGGERDAVRALVARTVDAACILDGNRLEFSREGTLPSGVTKVLAQTPVYDHCNFTAFDDGPVNLVARFKELLLGMSYSDPEIRPLLDLEQLKAWVPARVSGYAQLAAAIDRFGTIDPFIGSFEAACK